uniref:Uncharacterized protein n=1 Tax=Romanomermis culicivorax TaxID=13658 RepID=A0A915KM28_ROMCU
MLSLANGLQILTKISSKCRQILVCALQMTLNADLETEKLSQIDQILEENNHDCSRLLAKFKHFVGAYDIFLKIEKMTTFEQRTARNVIFILENYHFK